VAGRKADLAMAVLLTVWFTLLCGGFAWLYWSTGFVDPRNFFGSFLSDVGGIVVFPVGWAVLVWEAWELV
jgi:hypothetical protein